MHALSLGLILFGTWLLLSGILAPLILVLGLASCAAVVAIAVRMDVIDREAVPVHLTLGAIVYWPWLLWQVLKANVDVARRVFRREPDISPTMTALQATQKSDLGRVTLANSITLTPGTISIDVGNDGRILVHALAREGIDSLGEMDRRVTAMESMGADGGGERC